ncbi:uncharacterized protein LOC143296715 [Babylonia areolata]|uniref:uncharacterized protein LOC143296715 n=1 Tax=Babylonia areolata TaxID=304850 RepID=UPI003FCFCAAE
MSVFRKLGPYVVCLAAGAATGAGLVYLLYVRLNREIAEIRKIIHELRQEVDIYSDNNRRKKNSNRTKITGQYSFTASSGDDDDDFVDAVAGLSDNAVGEKQGEPELVGVTQLPSTWPEERNREAATTSVTSDHLSPVREVPDFVEDFSASKQAEAEEEEKEDLEEETEAETDSKFVE